LGESLLRAGTPEAVDQIVEDMLKSPQSPQVITYLLQMVAYCGTGKSARLLLQRGAEINYGVIAKSVHNDQKSVSVLQALIDSGLDVNTPLKYQGDALAIAILYNKVDAVRLLLKSGARPRENEGSQGQTTLGDAAVYGSPEIVSMLVESGVEINKSRALELAARAGRKDNVLCLLEKGADVDEVPDTEWWYVSNQHREEGLGSALHAAASQGHSEIVSLLIEKGANIYLEDSLGRTAFRRAILGMHPYAAAVLSKAMLLGS